MKPYTIEVSPDEVLDFYSNTDIIQYMIDNSFLESCDLATMMRGLLNTEIIEAFMSDRYVHDPVKIYELLGESLKKEGLI